MKKISIILWNSRKKEDIYDKGIRFWQWLFTRGTSFHYTHSEFLLDFDERNKNGMMYGSKPTDGGVRKKPFTKDHFDSDVWDYIDIYITDTIYNNLKEKLTKEIGEKYGWLSIVLSQIFKLDLDLMDNVICSEYVADALEYTDITMFKKHPNEYDVSMLVDELIEKGYTIRDKDNNIIVNKEKGFLNYFVK